MNYCLLHRALSAAWKVLQRENSSGEEMYKNAIKYVSLLNGIKCRKMVDCVLVPLLGYFQFSAASCKHLFLQSKTISAVCF